MINEFVTPQQVKYLTDVFGEYITDLINGYDKSKLSSSSLSLSLSSNPSLSPSSSLKPSLSLKPSPSPSPGLKPMHIFFECCIIFGKNNSVFCDDIENKIYSREYFNILVDNVPNSITQLFFVRNQPVEKIIIPKSITRLTFSHIFNQKVNNLPNTIVVLTFGDDFNKPVNFLPNSITHLTFGKNFNKCANYFPKSIKYLVFGHNFNKHINDLPISLIHLTIGHDFNKPINKLPNSIKYIKINRPSDMSDNLLQEIKTLLPNAFIDIELLSELSTQLVKTPKLTFIDIELLSESPTQLVKTSKLTFTPKSKSTSTSISKSKSTFIPTTSLTQKYNNLLHEITELFPETHAQQISNTFINVDSLSDLPTQTFLLDEVSKSSNKISSRTQLRARTQSKHNLCEI